MPKALSEQAVTQFHDHGWLSPVPVFSRQETERYQRKFAEWETRNGGPVGGQLRNKSHLFLSWLDELVRHPAILDVVEDVIGPNIWLWHAQFLSRRLRPRTLCPSIKIRLTGTSIHRWGFPPGLLSRPAGKAAVVCALSRIPI